MIRIVHLIGHETSFEAQRGIQMLARGLGEGFESTVVRIGKDGPCRSWLSAARYLRRQAGHFDVIHAWDGYGLAAGIGAGPVVLSLAGPPGRTLTRWLRAAMINLVNLFLF